VNTIFGLIRHGCTAWNEQGRMQGHRDIPLNERGRWQAARLGERLRGESWDMIVSSDLSRAKETASIIAQISAIPVAACDKRLRERDLGPLEGTTEEERLARWGGNWRQLSLVRETDEQLTARGFAVIEELARTFAGKRILIVSHGGMIKRLLSAVDPLRGEAERIDNTSLSVIEKTGSAWNTLLINCTAHLRNGLEKYSGK
jgi:probable phosphoglycerate mutase